MRANYAGLLLILIFGVAFWFGSAAPAEAVGCCPTCYWKSCETDYLHGITCDGMLIHATFGPGEWILDVWYGSSQQYSRRSSCGSNCNVSWYLPFHTQYYIVSVASTSGTATTGQVCY